MDETDDNDDLDFHYQEKNAAGTSLLAAGNKLDAFGAIAASDGACSPCGMCQGMLIELCYKAKPYQTQCSKVT